MKGMLFFFFTLFPFFQKVVHTSHCPCEDFQQLICYDFNIKAILTNITVSAIPARVTVTRILIKTINTPSIHTRVTCTLINVCKIKPTKVKYLISQFLIFCGDEGIQRFTQCMEILLLMFHFHHVQRS